MSSISHCPTSPGGATPGLDLDGPLDTGGTNPFQFQNDPKLNSNYTNPTPTRPPSSMSMASISSSRSSKVMNAPEKFSRQMVDIVFGLWNKKENPEDPIAALPKNSDDKPYREEQIEQLGARIHKDLRRMKQNNPGHANIEFINTLNMALKMAKDGFLIDRFHSLHQGSTNYQIFGPDYRFGSRFGSPRCVRLIEKPTKVNGFEK